MKNSEVATKLASELLKLTIIILLAVGAWNFSKWVGNHPIVPEYSANLTAEQEKLKEYFLHDQDSPGILTEKEMKIITNEVMSSTKIFGIQVSGIKYPDLSFALGATSLTSFLFYMIGYLSAIGIRKNEFTRFYFFLTATIIFVTSYLVYSTYGFELTVVIFIMNTTVFAIGLANWPLWHLCDKFIDPEPEKRTA